MTKAEWEGVKIGDIVVVSGGPYYGMKCRVNDKYCRDDGKPCLDTMYINRGPDTVRCKGLASYFEKV